MLQRMIAALFGGLVAFSGVADAQTYPARPITMIIPFAAGGPTDVLGRVVAQRMGEVLGQQVIVENVGGAGGMTGSARVANAAPDGYNFVIGTVGTHAQGQTLYKRPLYNSVTDFTPVALIASVPIVLITRKDPRSGDTVYRLTNILRAEPPPDLFTVPSDYRVVDMRKKEPHIVFEQELKKLERARTAQQP